MRGLRNPNVQSRLSRTVAFLVLTALIVALIAMAHMPSGIHRTILLFATSIGALNALLCLIAGTLSDSMLWTAGTMLLLNVLKMSFFGIDWLNLAMALLWVVLFLLRLAKPRCFIA